MRAPRKDFTIGRNLHFYTFHRNSNRTNFAVFFFVAVYRNHRTGFSKAITLHHHNAGSRKYPCQSRLKRSTSRNNKLHFTAQGFTPFIEDNFVRQIKLKAIPPTHVGMQLVALPQTKSPEK